MDRAFKIGDTYVVRSLMDVPSKGTDTGLTGYQMDPKAAGCYTESNTRSTHFYHEALTRDQ